MTSLLKIEKRKTINEKKGHAPAPGEGSHLRFSLFALRFPTSRRGFATFMAIWAVALVTLVLVTLQATAFREAAAGREAVARVRAYWAARAGVESQIAILTANTITPDPSSAFTVTTEMAAAARADVSASASYAIRHTEPGGYEEVDGPEDAHAKLNVNTLDTADLMMLEGMDETVAQSIHNWIHGVDDTALVTGADEGTYSGLRYPYRPREAPVRSLKELELIKDVDPRLVRGDDWNLNSRLDPNEDDGDASFPPDDANARLDAGWSQYLTAVSDGETWGASGQKRLDLTTATAEEIASRLQVDATQAAAISAYATGDVGTLASFVSTDLADLAAQASGGTTGGTLLNGQTSPIANLSDEQLATLLNEATLGEAARNGPRTGKVNINTVTRETLERLARVDAATADALITERDARAGGFVSLTELLAVPSVDRATLADLMTTFDVRSNVYVVTSRGRDKATGLEVEIVAVVDRSSIPVVIKDLFVR